MTIHVILYHKAVFNSKTPKSAQNKGEITQSFWKDDTGLDAAKTPLDKPPLYLFVRWTVFIIFHETVFHWLGSFYRYVETKKTI